MFNRYWFKKIAFLSIALFTVFSMVLPVRVNAAATELTFNTEADAYVISTSPNRNYGTSSVIRVDNSPETRSYLRFVVIGLNNNPVQAARLRIFANSVNKTGFIVNLVNDSTWDEKTITYNNSPVVGGFIKQSQAMKKGIWIEVDLTGIITSDGIYTLAITSKSNTATSIASRKSSGKAPQIVLTSGDGEIPQITPEPSVTPLPTILPTLVPNPTDIPTLEPTIVPTNLPTATSTPTNPPGTDWQPAFPIRAAFYYPWFPEAWDQQSTYPYTNFTPTLGYYNNSDQTILKEHIDMMQYGNIQSGIASWWGQGSRSDNRIGGLLTAAKDTNFRWTLYYENESLGNPSSGQINTDLQYIHDKYGNDPSYLRVNGKFVVFVYADATDGCGMADRWKTGNTVGAYVVLKVFAGYKTCASQPDGWHQYSPAVATDQQGSESYSVSPGFWLKGQPVRLARDFNPLESKCKRHGCFQRKVAARNHIQ